VLPVRTRRRAAAVSAFEPPAATQHRAALSTAASAAGPLVYVAHDVEHPERALALGERVTRHALIVQLAAAGEQVVPVVVAGGAVALVAVRIRQRLGPLAGELPLWLVAQPLAHPAAHPLGLA